MMESTRDAWLAELVSNVIKRRALVRACETVPHAHPLVSTQSVIQYRLQGKCTHWFVIAAVGG